MAGLGCDSWPYDPAASFWIFMAENHQELPAGRSCDGGLGGCEVCGDCVLVSNGRGESVLATWDAVRRVGGAEEDTGGRPRRSQDEVASGV